MSDKLLGKRVGNYIISELIGEGGMGAVYRAEHPDIGRRVAIKLLDLRLGEHPEVCKRFLTEARAIARIEHPNVIDIFDFGRTLDGQLYYVMELLKGMELRRAMEQKGAMTPAEVQPFVEQICDGLQAAHEHDVVHRDLKPENIYILESQRLALKIIDFGIARLDDPGFQGPSRTAKGVVMGTPLTISPEQAEGRPERVGPRTDIYSLGVIIYWMLAGRPPFADEPPAVILARHITDAPPPLGEHVPDPLADLVFRCLAKDPDQRPSSARDVAVAFEQALGARFEGSVSGLFRAQGPPEIAFAKTMPPEPRATDAPDVVFNRPARLPTPEAPQAAPGGPPGPVVPTPLAPVVPTPLAPAAAPPPAPPEPEPVASPEPEPVALPEPEPAPPPVAPPAEEAGPIQRVPSAEELLGALTGGPLEPDDEEPDDELAFGAQDRAEEQEELEPLETPSLQDLAAEQPGPAELEQEELEPDDSAPWPAPEDDLPPFDLDEGVVSVTPLPGAVPGEEKGRARSRMHLVGGALAAVGAVAAVVVGIVLLSSGPDVAEEAGSLATTKAERPKLELTPLPALHGGPPGPETLLRAGEREHRAGKLSAAVRQYKAALAAAPRHGHVLFRMAEARQARGEAQVAEEGYRTALEADAALAAAAHFKLGDLYESHGEATKAIAEYKASIEADARYVPPLVALGFTYARLRRYDDAIVRLDRAVELEPGRALAHYYRGTVLFNLDRADEAIAAYRKALELQPRYPAAHYYLGQVHLKKGDKAAARAQFRAALEDDPEYEPAVLALSKLK